MLHVGDKVPDFKLPIANAEGTREEVSFRSLLGNGPVVLTFFPLAFSGVCTPHMCEVSNELSALQAMGVKNVVGFSTDSVMTNIAFVRQNHLATPIFSDANREVVNEIWGTTTTANVKNTPIRGWMVIGSDGTVLAKWEAPNPGVWSGVKPIGEVLLNAK